MKNSNIFKNLPTDTSQEVIENLLEIVVSKQGIRIERIISTGQSSPKDFWYDQDENEWLIVLQGSAAIRFQEDNQTITLKIGDYIHIPAHQKHRVEWTDTDIETIWLAIFY